MTEDRSSGLQKWILTHALSNNGVLTKRYVYENYFHLESVIRYSLRENPYRDTKHERRRQVFATILSNSLRRMKEKGLITYTNLRNTHRLGMIRLTEEGRLRAESITIQ